MAETQEIEVSLHVSSDAMTVTADCSASPGELDTVRNLLEQKISELKLAGEVGGLDMSHWVGDVVADDDNIHVEAAVLFEGGRPRPPRNGALDWARDFFIKGDHADPETGAMDYRQPVAHDEVIDGQLLFRITPAEEGEDGTDVFGKTVKAAKPTVPEATCGDGVRRDGDAFYATTSGKVRWKSNCLSVDQVLVINGDVGLRTGDLSHRGPILVTEDGLDGSTIDVDGDVEVKGVVEASNIRSGGKLLVHGGFAGHDGFKVEIASDVRSRFMLEVDLTAGNDVVVNRKILHSTIRTPGAVLVAEGRIVGGDSRLAAESRPGLSTRPSNSARIAKSERMRRSRAPTDR
jgi:uncharacterized protein (DUF342 family)